MTAYDWRPNAALEQLQLRARLMAEVRQYFAEREILEVETPLLSQAATTAPHLDSFAVLVRLAQEENQAAVDSRIAGDEPVAIRPDSRSWRYLQTSPEFAMKRLLANGSGPIYQLCKVFRQDENGRRHNAEFTLLEWYRPGFNLDQLMAEVEALVGQVLELPTPIPRMTYARLFADHLQLDIFSTDVAALRQCAAAQGLAEVAGMADADHDSWLDLLLSHVIEPRLAEYPALFVTDYPASQASLAKIRPGSPAVAERFELYVKGIELANGFHELADADEQRQRFVLENQQRQRLGKPIMPVDEALLAALAAGLPDCSGVALGFDRLVMLAAGAIQLQQVLAFDYYRA